MLIENPDALKVWLTQILEPLCEADPAALARYVLALLKKDKVAGELSKCMSEQLDVFLGAQTAPFLVRLFAAIESLDYLKGQPVDSSQMAAQLLSETSSSALTNLPSAAVSAQPSSDSASRHPQQLHLALSAVECDPTPAAVTIGTHSDILIEHASPIVSPAMSPVSRDSSSQQHPQQHPNQHAATRSDHPVVHDREVRRHRNANRSRTRSRSRSFERGMGGRDRNADKSSGGGGGHRQFRNKSPPAGGGTGGMSFERRSDGRRGNNNGGGSWKSRSRSPDRWAGHRNNKLVEDNGANKAKRQRCRDFEEKGYCMRGETCPWDHGVDPVVLEDISNPALISIQSSTAHGRSAEYSPDAPELWTRGANFGGRGGGGNNNSNNGANNNNTMSHRGGHGSYPRGGGVALGGGDVNFRGGSGPPAPFTFPINATPLQRELIAVPVLDGNQGGDVSAGGHQKRRYEPEDTVAVAEGPAKRKPPINSRLGPRVGGGGGNGAMQQNCSLEMRKVPRGLNSIFHLNNHFCKFGKIVNIQVSYEGDPEAATVTFSSHAEANVAYRSTEAVLNNRFIKVFWHSAPTVANEAHHNKEPENGQQQQQPHIRHKGPYSLHNNTSNAPPPHHNNGHPAVPAVPTAAATDIQKDAASTGGATTIPAASTPLTAADAQAAANLRARNNRVNRAATEIIRKKQEDKVKAAVQLAHGLHKRKHELLQEYLKQMRSALELVERVDHTDAQRPQLLATIKSLQTTIDNLNKEIAAEQAKMSAQMQPQSAQLPVVRKSREQQKKELLDIELELIAQQQDGNDTTEIQRRIEELQRSLGVPTSKAPGHFGAVRAPRVRPPPPGSTSVDRRPTTLQVTGFAADDGDALLGHFKHFGEVTKNELDINVPLLVIAFATRINAEQAMLRGRTFKDTPLQISWVATPSSISQHSKLQLQLKDEPLSSALAVEATDQPPKKQQKTDLQQLEDELDLELLDDDDEDIITSDDLGTQREAKLLGSTEESSSNVNNNNNSEQLQLDEEEEEDDAEESEDRSWRR